MKKEHYIHLMILLLISCSIQAVPRIVLFFKQAPLTDAEKISQKLKKPGKLAKYVAKGMMKASPIEGIVAVYGGYMAASDHNGELSFPRKHQKSIVNILITPEIVPVPLSENTILNWRRIPGIPATMYECEVSYNEDKAYHYWQTREVPLEENMTVPLATIVVVAKPKNVQIDLEKALTHETANLVLPSFYVKKGINVIENSLYMLTVRHLFKPIHTEENREPLKIITDITD